MNRWNNPRDSEVFVVGQSVITLRPDRRTAAPTEYEVIQHELRKISEIKARRRRAARPSKAR